MSCHFNLALLRHDLLCISTKVLKSFLIKLVDANTKCSKFLSDKHSLHVETNHMPIVNIGTHPTPSMIDNQSHTRMPYTYIGNKNVQNPGTDILPSSRTSDYVTAHAGESTAHD